MWKKQAPVLFSWSLDGTATGLWKQTISAWSNQALSHLETSWGFVYIKLWTISASPSPLRSSMVVFTTALHKMPINISVSHEISASPHINCSTPVLKVFSSLVWVFFFSISTQMCLLVKNKYLQISSHWTHNLISLPKFEYGYLLNQEEILSITVYFKLTNDEWNAISSVAEFQNQCFPMNPTCPWSTFEDISWVYKIGWHFKRSLFWKIGLAVVLTVNSIFENFGMEITRPGS